MDGQDKADLEEERGQAASAPASPPEQPDSLKELLNAINVARRQFTLYGADHPNTANIAAALSDCLRQFLSDFGPSTLVFSSDAIIVNDRYYPASRDSADLCRRLRDRGVTAITFAEAPSEEEVTGLLGLLAAEPREIREAGEAETYLVGRGVARITVAPAVYTGGDEADLDLDAAAADLGDPEHLDMVISSIIEMLADDAFAPGDGSEYPIAEILSDPHTAAKLISAAIAKLQGRQPDLSSGDAAAEAMCRLRDLAGSEAEKWDDALPRIRKIVAALPEELRPKPSQFVSAEQTGTVKDADGADAVLTVEDAENLVTKALGRQSELEVADALPDIEDIESFIGARPTGLLSTWSAELRPESIIERSGQTLTTLVAWERSQQEHARLAAAMAALIKRAVEVGDHETALTLADSLAREVLREGDLSWRAANARAALRRIQNPSLLQLIRTALRGANYRAKEVASVLVETCPELALGLAALLGEYEHEGFDESLKRGVLRLGSAAVTPLARIVRTGSAAARSAALELLAQIGSGPAVREISHAVQGEDAALAIQALGILARIKAPRAADVCAGALSHPSSSVRCAAIKVLAELSGEAALSHIVRTAMRGSLRETDISERVAAVEALGTVGTQAAVETLKRIASRSPLFGRKRYRPIRAAALAAIDRIRAGESGTWPAAA